MSMCALVGCYHPKGVFYWFVDDPLFLLSHINGVEYASYRAGLCFTDIIYERFRPCHH